MRTVTVLLLVLLAATMLGAVLSVPALYLGAGLGALLIWSALAVRWMTDGENR